jgi:hypothetical protein
MSDTLAPQASAPGQAQRAPQPQQPQPRPDAADRLQAVPIRVLGALLLVGALDPARWPDYLCPQWFFGVIAAVAGLWAGAPVVRRPVMDSHRWADQLRRHRNTLLAAASALLAALQSPPVWLMAVQTLLLLGYLMLVDASVAAARSPRAQLNQALCAAAAAALVLLAAVAPVTGGWWARFVAALAVLGTLALVYAALRLRRPAGFAQGAGDAVEQGRAPANARRH